MDNRDLFPLFGEIIKEFNLKGDLKRITCVSTGNINDTYVGLTEYLNGEREYIFQRVNHLVFKDPDRVAENVCKVTDHVERKIRESGVHDFRRRVLRYYRKPDNSYFHVTDANGVVLLSDTLAPRAVLREENAAIMTEMMKNVVTSGTAKGKVSLIDRTEVAGKTGTTQRGVDRWFVGYTPAVLGGVWTGYDYPAEREGIETNVSITVWDEVMTLLYERGLFDGYSTEFDLPDSLVRLPYCVDSGQIPTDACRADLRGTRSRTGYFTEDNCPRHECQTHELVDYDTVFGGVASELCPPDVRRAVGFLRGERDFPQQVFVRDAPYFLWDGPPGEGRFRGEWYATPSKTTPCPAHTEEQPEDSTEIETQDP